MLYVDDLTQSVPLISDLSLLRHMEPKEINHHSTSVIALRRNR
jgi:hypothetical protein